MSDDEEKMLGEAIEAEVQSLRCILYEAIIKSLQNTPEGVITAMWALMDTATMIAGNSPDQKGVLKLFAEMADNYAKGVYRPKL